MNILEIFAKCVGSYSETDESYSETDETDVGKRCVHRDMPLKEGLVVGRYRDIDAPDHILYYVDWKDGSHDLHWKENLRMLEYE